MKKTVVALTVAALNVAGCSDMTPEEQEAMLEAVAAGLEGFADGYSEANNYNRTIHCTSHHYGNMTSTSCF